MVRHEFSSLTPAEDQTWLSSIFDYIESHPDIEATAYLDIKGAPETALEQQAPHVFLDGGQVSYRPYDPAQTAYDDTNDGRYSPRAVPTSAARSPAEPPTGTTPR